MEELMVELINAIYSPLIDRIGVWVILIIAVFFAMQAASHHLVQLSHRNMRVWLKKHGIE